MPILIPRPVVSLSKYPGGKEAPALPTAAGILRLSLKEMSLPDMFGVTHPGLAGCFGVITLIPRRFLPKFRLQNRDMGEFKFIMGEGKSNPAPAALGSSLGAGEEQMSYEGVSLHLRPLSLPEQLGSVPGG